MALVARRLEDGEPIWAKAEEPTSALCQDVQCDAPMYRRAGKGFQPHWAHMPGTAEGCRAATSEGPWHVGWKHTCPDAHRCEAYVGKRKADVLAKFGWAIEFQHSNISRADLQAREDDWNGDLIWVQDGTDGESGKIEIEGSVKAGPGRSVEFFWEHPPNRIAKARCHQLVDIGNGALLWLPPYLRAQPSHAIGPLTGWLISHESFIETWVNGKSRPLFPLGWTSRWEVEGRRPPTQESKPQPSRSAVPYLGTCERRDWAKIATRKSDNLEHIKRTAMDVVERAKVDQMRSAASQYLDMVEEYGLNVIGVVRYLREMGRYLGLPHNETENLITDILNGMR